MPRPKIVTDNHAMIRRRCPGSTQWYTGPKLGLAPPSLARYVRTTRHSDPTCRERLTRRRYATPHSAIDVYQTHPAPPGSDQRDQDQPAPGAASAVQSAGSVAGDAVQGPSGAGTSGF